MDALSEVLRSVRLEGAVFLEAEFTAPWCVRAQFGLSNARALLAGADHVLFFHWLVDGACRVRLADGQEASGASGDLLLFPHDDRHLLGTDLQLTPVEMSGAGASDASGLGRIRMGGGGVATRFVCGYLTCNRSVLRPLLEALPRMLRIPLADAPAAGLLREVLRVGVEESASSRPGNASMRARLAELLVVEALRSYAESLPPEGRGWLAGMRDSHVGRALALLHGDPGRAWTVDDLAREVALSRSALAERFAALIGEPPITYLMRWRLALAARALRSDGGSIARIAERSGYRSEAAFSRAFKREFGLSPMAWRKAGAA